MASWPTTLPAPDNGIEEELYLPQRKIEFEANYVQTGKRVTRGRRRWPLSWKLMTEAEYQVLEVFFCANQGGRFDFTHPTRNTSHVCVFSSDSLRHKWRSAGWVASVQCPIEEL